jgi:hypothetical protein
MVTVVELVQTVEPAPNSVLESRQKGSVDEDNIRSTTIMIKKLAISEVKPIHSCEKNFFIIEPPDGNFAPL